MSWPHISVEIDQSHTIKTIISGLTTYLEAPTLPEARQKASAYIGQYAAKLGRTLTVKVSDPEGKWTIKVAPDGTVTGLPTVKRSFFARKRSRHAR